MTAGMYICVCLWVKNINLRPDDEQVFLLLRFAIKLLEDVVFFVADVQNSGQLVLNVVMSKANRERQKLMREQNILKQVGSRNYNKTRN